MNSEVSSVDTMSDWLALHGLTPDICRELLAAAPLITPQTYHGAKVDVPDPDAVWEVSRYAWLQMLPSMAVEIDQTAQLTERNFDPAASNRPMTKLQPGEKTSVVNVPYRYRASDVLDVFHEFSHALHHRAVVGEFVPPLIREVVAVCGEGLAVHHLSKAGETALAELCLSALAKRVASTFAADGYALLTALDQPQHHYCYDWNYPCARALVPTVNSQGAASALSRLLNNTGNIGDLLPDFGQPELTLQRYASIGRIALRTCEEKPELSIRSFVKVVAPDVFSLDFSSLCDDAFFVISSRDHGPLPTLGAALVTLALSDEHTEFSLGRYVQREVIPPIRQNQARVFLTSESWPLGFVTWAWVQERLERKVHEMGRPLDKLEWMSGDQLLVIDWMSLPQFTDRFARCLENRVFLGQAFTGPIRSADLSSLDVV